MKLPFVSRGTLDLLVASERARALAAEAAVVAVEARYDKLLEIVVAERTPKEVPVKAADPIMALIRARAGSNGVVRRALGAYVMTQRALDTPEGQIIEGLTHWQSSDDDGVDG
jgi:hypothetical protein